MSIDIEAVKGAIALPDFTRTDLLEIALTHPSRIYENIHLNYTQKTLQEREYRRLAILGDAILGAAVIDYLHLHFPNLNQGEITTWKSDLVRRKKAFDFARSLQLRRLCLLGKSESLKNESRQVDLFGEMFEALLGAIYLEFDRDFSRACDWLVTHFIEKAVSELLNGTPACEEVPEEMGLTPADRRLLEMKRQADALLAEDKILQQLLVWINQKSLTVSPAYKPAKVRAFYLALVRVFIFNLLKAFDDASRRRSQARSFALVFERTRNLALDIAFDFDPKNILLCLFLLDLEPELTRAMQELESELPHPDKEAQLFDDWRVQKGRAWVEKLTGAIAYDFQLDDRQKNLLKEYYKATKSLIEYLNSGCEVSPAVRQDIEETLFLPIAEIQAVAEPPARNPDKV